MYRRKLKGNLPPEDYKLPDHHLAAFIIKTSTLLPEVITPLLPKYHYYTTINNKDRTVQVASPNFHK